MQYLLLVVAFTLIVVQSVVTKQYDMMVKEKNIFFFLSITTLVAMLSVYFSAGCKFTFSTDYMIYSVGWAICCFICNVAGYYTIAWGTLTINGLVSSYSLIIPVFYGLIALGEKLSTAGMVGIACLLLSVFLVNDSKEKATFSWKLLISLVLFFGTGGMCAVIQKMHQQAFGEAYKNDYLIVAYFLATILQLITSWLHKEKIRKDVLLCVGLGALRGAANGIYNLLVLILTGLIPNVILFPTVSAGGLVLGFIVAVGIYKERLSKRQIIGYAFGTIAVILINL